MRGTVPRTPTLASQVWAYLTSRAGIEPQLSRRVWGLLAARPETLALRYGFTQALLVGPPGSPARKAAAAALVHGLGRPESVITSIELLVTTQRLSRHEATLVQEKLLALVTSAGEWK